MRVLGRTLFLCGALVALSSLWSSPSWAAPPMLQPSTRPMWAAFEMGGAISMSNAIGQFKIGQIFGYHLNGSGDGFAVGGALQESMGSDVFALQLGPRIWYDFQPVKDLGLYLAPIFQLGWAMASGGGTSIHAFNMQFGFEPKLVLGDRGVIYMRFFTIDMWLRSPVAARYDFMIGGGVTF